MYCGEEEVVVCCHGDEYHLTPQTEHAVKIEQDIRDHPVLLGELADPKYGATALKHLKQRVCGAPVYSCIFSVHHCTSLHTSDFPVYS